MKIKQLPNVLALHLKRFKYQEDVQRYIKLAYRVAFPFELRLFNTVDDVPNPDRLYRLFAIVVHIGNGPNHGHYVSIIKTTGAWLVFDDETVDTIRESDISKYFGESNSGSAYVLYYQAVDLDPVALGLRSPSPEQVEQVVAHPDQPQRHLADSPASTSQALPSLPPGLDLVPRESSAAPLAPPLLPPQPVPISPSREPLPTTPKSPRKSPSQLLRLSLGSPSSPIRALTIGTGATPEATSPEKIGPLHPVRQTAAPEKKPDSPSNVATSPLALSPKGDPASHEPVREKEKDEKRIPSWFRSRSFKGKPRPNSETNADQPPLPTTVVLETAPIPFHRPALSSQPKISAGSSGSFSNGSAHVNHRRPATSAGKPHTTSREGYAHNPPSLSTTPSVSSAGASSSTSSDRYTRALPPIPGSPQSKIPHGPPTSFVRGSSDFDRTHRRHNTDREPPKVFSTRPATSSGPSSADAPSSRYMNGSARVPPVSNGHVFHSANVDPFASLYNTVKSNSKSSTTKSQPLLANGRPKSAHGLSIQSLVGASSAASSAAGTTIRRATRKLSFSSQMLGFGKKDKKDRERESEREELPKSPNGHARPSPPPYNVNGFAA
ncbi:hypothetical protein ID866_4959 [Astraeus odoratus]|nr:hypothetical protein ID866_4959 [Astraeus odoratus]